MATNPHSPLLTPADYLAAERRAETRSEFVDGEVRAMTGASRAHGLIVISAVLSLGTQLRGRPCEMFSADMRVKVSRTGAYVYPDLVVVCGEPELEDAAFDTLLNPTVVIEVLSPSTADYDHGRKWEHYRRLPSLQEYLLVAQEQPRVERYVRQGGEMWLFSEASGLDDVLDLDSIGCTLALRELYERVIQS